VQDGRWTGGRNAVFGLDRHGVGLGTFSPKASKADIAKVDAVRDQLAAGELGNIPTTLG
jgi:hypothetical protein